MNSGQLSLAPVDDRAAPIAVADQEWLQGEQSLQVERRQPDLNLDGIGTSRTGLGLERRVVPAESLATFDGSRIYRAKTSRFRRASRLYLPCIWYCRAAFCAGGALVMRASLGDIVETSCAKSLDRS